MGKRNTKKIVNPMSVRAWLAQPQKVVTRGELWSMLELFHKIEKRSRWWRRLYRWFKNALIKPKDSRLENAKNRTVGEVLAAKQGGLHRPKSS